MQEQEDPEVGESSSPSTKRSKTGTWGGFINTVKCAYLSTPSVDCVQFTHAVVQEKYTNMCVCVCVEIACFLVAPGKMRFSKKTPFSVSHACTVIPLEWVGKATQTHRNAHM